MQPYLFLSDLHLHDSRPQITELFFRFLKKEATKARAVYILGDLFEFWAGDDANTYPEVINALHTATDQGIPIFFMRGNRDFLTGEQFALESGCVMLTDPTVIDIDGIRVLLMHGDTLCTDDTEYQTFRQQVRSSEWQNKVISMPLSERMAYFQSLREASKKSMLEKPEYLMDTNQNTVEIQMAEADVHLLIHGHTHRQAIHHFELNNKPATRIVLGDWDKSGHVLYVNSPEDYIFRELTL